MALYRVRTVDISMNTHAIWAHLCTLHYTTFSVLPLPTKVGTSVGMRFFVVSIHRCSSMFANRHITCDITAWTVLEDNQVFSMGMMYRGCICNLHVAICKNIDIIFLIVIVGPKGML